MGKRIEKTENENPRMRGRGGSRWKSISAEKLLNLIALSDIICLFFGYHNDTKSIDKPKRVLFHHIIAPFPTAGGFTD